LARSARCDVRWGAAVFVESDETFALEQLDLNAFRRLLLQIGGAHIAGADRAVKAAAFLTCSQPAMPSAELFASPAARSFVQDSGARDLAKH